MTGRGKGFPVHILQLLETKAIQFEGAFRYAATKERIACAFAGFDLREVLSFRADCEGILSEAECKIEREEPGMAAEGLGCQVTPRHDHYGILCAKGCSCCCCCCCC
jgi:hypothetical protein